MLTFEFVKHKGAWCFYHEEYARRSGSKDPYTAVYKEGLHSLLEAIGKNAMRIVIQISDQPFEGCDELELTRQEADGRGGYYLLKTLYGKPYVLLIRFMDVQSFFGYLPARMYLTSEVPA